MRRLLFALALVLAACGTRGASGGPGDAGHGGDLGGGDARSSGCVRELGALPASPSGDTSGGECAALSRYACAASEVRDGREVVYHVHVPADGFLLASKDAAAAPGTTVSILSALDEGACVDTHATNAGARVLAGDDAYVVVDEPAGAEGAFTLHVALTTTETFTSHGVFGELAADALTVFEHAWSWGATRRSEYVVVDFSLHSAADREWVFDLATGELLWNLRVAHGRASTDGVDLAHAVTFSNTGGSNQSSLGLLRSAGTYVGTYGPSFRLEGLEPGINDHVCARDIVMHPWAPVGDEYVARCGWARPSLGCPAIDSTIAMPVRDRLARPDGAPLDEGVLMLFWSPGSAWQAGSVYRNGSAPTAEVTATMAVECDSSTDSTPMPPASGDYPCD